MRAPLLVFPLLLAVLGCSSVRATEPPALPPNEPALLEQILAVTTTFKGLQGTALMETTHRDTKDAPPNQQELVFVFAVPDRYALVARKPADTESFEAFYCDGTQIIHETQVLADEGVTQTVKPLGNDDLGARVLRYLALDRQRLDAEFTLSAWTLPANPDAKADDPVVAVALSPKDPAKADMRWVRVLLDQQRHAKQVLLEDNTGNSISVKVDAQVVDPATIAAGQFTRPLRATP